MKNKFNWCWNYEEYFMTEYEWMKAFRSVSVSGDMGLGSGFVYLIPCCWVVMLSDRYMYKLSEPWENHRSCCRFSSRAASISVTDTPNECKLSCFFPPFFCIHAFHTLRDFCVLLWNWHLLLRVSDCMSVLVNESVKLTLLRGVFVQSKTEHWTYLSASGLLF